MTPQTTSIRAAIPETGDGLRPAFAIAWFFCLLFHLMEYAVHSAPSVMFPELTQAFRMTPLGLGSLLGLYHYSYPIFAVAAGAALDRWGAKLTIPFGVLMLPLGTAITSLPPALRTCSPRRVRSG